jgi:vancomycin permeability regulator SanA
VEHADIALVLGNKVELDGTPSPRLKARLDKAAELYHAGYFPRVLVSGGIGKEGHDEAQVMAEYLVKKGVPQEMVLRDNEGNTTYDSARKTAQLAREQRFGRVLVVSQYFHIPRSVLALRKTGLEPVYHAHARHVEWLRDPYSITRELAGYITYHFKDFPSALPEPAQNAAAYDGR